MRMDIEFCLNNSVVKDMLSELLKIKSFATVEDYVNSFDYTGLNRLKRRFVQHFAKKTYYLARENKLLVEYRLWYQNYNVIYPLLDAVNKFEDKFVCLTFKDEIVNRF